MISTILARLQEAGTPFRIAGGAAQLAEVKDRPAQLPAVYAYVARERSEPNEQMNAHRQRMAVDIAVVIVAGNLSNATSLSAAAADDLDALKSYVRGQLLGWSFGALDPFEHVEGEMQSALSGVVWFEDVYTTATYLEAA